MSTAQDVANIILSFVPIILVGYGIFTVSRYLASLVTPRTRHNNGSIDTPVLVSGIMPDGTDLIGGASGTTPGGMHYDYYVGGLSLFSSDQTRGLFSVELPFMSGIHLIGLPRQSETPVSIASHSEMEPVELEGDYNDHFRLYADKGQQTQSRYVLDPTAMVFTLDFCDTFNWEIQGDTLYFMSTASLPSFTLIDEFVRQIRPAIEIPSDRRKNPYRMSYTAMAGRVMNCPLCHITLVAGDAWLACPDGHGCLVTGGQLLDMNRGEEPIPTNEAVRIDHGDLTCPYCSNPMKASHYQNTPVIIDICTKCMYRWLDGGELTTLFRK